MRQRVVFVFFIILFGLAPVVHAETQVYFNLGNHKVHKMTCTWGQRCTRNCVVIPRSEAYKRGGVPCKVCGG